MMNGSIRGFETLLPALAAASSESINIYSVAAEAEWFLVFTDAKTSRLIGLLSDRGDSLFQFYKQANTHQAVADAAGYDSPLRMD